MRPYNVQRISSDAAQRVSVANHYLHRKCPCSAAYGLFDEQSKCIGVIIYGEPASSTLKRGICGASEQSHVIELKRLWIEDGVVNFPESFLIANSLHMLRDDLPHKDIVVSYADGGFGHVGVVYQCTNWIYTGTSAAFKDWVLKGDPRDHLTQQDEWKAKYGTVQEALKVFGDKAEKRERSTKHRYIFLNTKSRARKRELMSELCYDIQPYPKVEKIVHISNVNAQKSLFDFGEVKP